MDFNRWDLQMDCFSTLMWQNLPRGSARRAGAPQVTWEKSSCGFGSTACRLVASFAWREVCGDGYSTEDMGCAFPWVWDVVRVGEWGGPCSMLHEDQMALGRMPSSSLEMFLTKACECQPLVCRCISRSNCLSDAETANDRSPSWNRSIFLRLRINVVIHSTKCVFKASGQSFRYICCQRSGMCIPIRVRCCSVGECGGPQSMLRKD